MDFYVYQNWHRERARLHRGECRHCREGQGSQPVDSGRNGKWHGPIEERKAAQLLLDSFGYADAKECPFCCQE